MQEKKLKNKVEEFKDTFCVSIFFASSKSQIVANIRKIHVLDKEITFIFSKEDETGDLTIGIPIKKIKEIKVVDVNDKEKSQFTFTQMIYIEVK